MLYLYCVSYVGLIVESFKSFARQRDSEFFLQVNLLLFVGLILLFLLLLLLLH